MTANPIRRVLYAPNVHQGGGKALLLPLLNRLKSEADLLFVLDRRMEIPTGWSEHARIINVDPSLASRLSTEWQLRALLRPDMRVLCMGNLPPLFASTSSMTLFVQNRYLTGRAGLSDFPLRIRLRIALERLWFQLRTPAVNRFIVQTPTMQREFERISGYQADLLPFVDPESRPGRMDPERERAFDFVYVASGEPHKNHRNLVLAWVALAERGHFPSLCLTLHPERFADLLLWIERQQRQYRLKITNAGELSRDRLNSLYQCAAALVYPSLSESFGLPLFEAAAAGLPVLAADRSYVHDLISNPVTFDPQDPRALAHAVEFFAFSPAEIAIEVVDVETFLRETFAAEYTA